MYGGLVTSPLSPMRYPPEQKEMTRRKIMEAATKLFRERGYHAAGVDAIMGEAGLTAGGFYSHFKNKEALLIAIIESSPEITASCMPAGVQELEGVDWIIATGEWYLSPENRDNPDRSCPVPCLISEIGRQGEETRAAFAIVHQHMEQMFVAHLGEFPEERRLPIAQAILMMSMGAITTARGMGATPESDAYLADSRRRVQEMLENERLRMELTAGAIA